MIKKKITKNLSISGEVYSNSQAWGHEVKAFWCGREVAKNRVRYYNRTWEPYKFYSAWLGLVDKLDKQGLDGAVDWVDRVELYKTIKS